MHLDLIGPYSKSIRQQHPVGAIITINSSLACMVMIEPKTGCIKIVEIPTYNLDEVMGVNDDYTDKSSARNIQLFNITWISI